MNHQYSMRLDRVLLWLLVFSIPSFSQTAFDISIPNTEIKQTTLYSKMSKSGSSKVTIGDYVWFDYNQNGLQDFSEPSIYNITLNLYDNASCSGSPISTTKTTDVGYYEFRDIQQTNQKHCIEVIYPDKWTKTQSNLSDKTLNSDIETGTGTKGYIKDIVLGDNNHLDIGLHHSSVNCKSPLLKENDIGYYDSSKAWSKRYMLSVQFNGLMANGFCHEYLNAGPKKGDKYTVHNQDRLGFTAQQRDYLSRVFGFMSDQEVNTLIFNAFDSKHRQVWFNIVSATFVWYYSDWNRSFKKLEEFIDTKEYLQSLTFEEKQNLKKIARIVIDKVEGLNGKTQYPSIKVYYLWNQTNDKNQDIIVPSSSLVPSVGECKLPPVVVPELTCSVGYTKLLKNIWTAGRNDSKNLITKLFTMDGQESNFDVEKVWTYDNGTHQQNSEQFKIVFTNNANYVMATTAYTQDVKNEYNDNHQFSNLGTTLVPEKAVNALLVHKADRTYGNNINSYNSVTFKGMCYRVSKIEKPSIDIEVSTNDVDADKPTGPKVDYGETVTWKYKVENNGNVKLTNIIVSDSKLNQICKIVSLDAGATQVCEKVGKANEGQYSNVGTVKAKSPSDTEVMDSDPSHYLGGEQPAPKIDIEVSANEMDADQPTGPKVDFDSIVTLSYVVTNKGNVPLSNVVISDSKLKQICTVQTLAIGASEICMQTVIATEGQYATKGTVTGKSPTNLTVTDSDMTHYLGGEKPQPRVDIEVATNGIDADKPTGSKVEVDSQLTWKYTIENRGNVTLSKIVVTDNKLQEICTFGTLSVSEKKTCTKTGKAIEGQYANVGKVTAVSPNTIEVTDSDPSHYLGEKKVINYPIVKDDSKTGQTGEVVTLNTLSNDKGIDSDLNPSTVVFVHPDVQDNGKKLVVKGEGLWHINEVTGQSTFTPEKGFTNDPTPVQYTVEDMNGNLSNKGTQSIDYPQTVPTAKDDKKIGERCKAVIIQVLTNDIDHEEDLNVSSVAFVDLVDVWEASDSDNDGDIDTVVVPDEGTWSINPKGDVLYTPSNECTTSPTAIKYIVTDSTDKTSNKAVITVVYPEVEKASLGNLVWFDADKNGKQDSGEIGLQGVTVELYRSTGELSETTLTDDNGTYSFVNLDAGEYYVKFVVKEGYSFTKQDDEVSKLLDSNADITTGKTESISLNDGENNVSFDAGMYITEKPEIEVVKTTNDNNVSNIVVGDTITWKYKITNTGNVLLSNITVSDDKEGAILNCTGDGSLTALAPTKTLICSKTGVAILGAYTNKVTVKAFDPDNKSVEAEDSSSYEGQEAPLLPSKIGDYVWLDSNRNGIQDDTELPLQEIEVKLFNEEKKLLSSTKTNKEGKYFFNKVYSGKHYIQFMIPVGYTVTRKGIGNDKTLDSNVNANGKTSLFMVVEGVDDLNIDLGLYPTLTNLGDRVFLDSNANGIQDKNENDGIANVTVKLFNEENDLIAETKTNSSGQYFFRNLVPLNYYVQFVVPKNYKVSPKDQGANESDDSDADTKGKTEIITLIGGQDNKSVDMGLYQEGIKLGDRVFYDINKNGLQDAGETGIGDVKVVLYSTQNNDPIAETVTSASGIYRFENIEAGEYYVQFIPPVGYTVTKANQGDIEKDSNPNASGKTETFTLNVGQQDSSVDMGLYQKVVSIGDFVFLDSNHNGLQDKDEKGVRDVKVTIHSETSDFKKSMLTDENGNYLFRNLAAGEYYLEFKDIPYGHLVTKQDVNDNQNNANDSDGFLNNKKIITETTLLTAGKNDLSWDLGIYKTICLPGKSVLGNLVFEDYNKDGIQDVGERGVPNVPVTLYNNDTDEKIATTITDENGIYEFAHINPEFNYYVIFTVPNGFVVSPQDQDEESIDSDADENGKTDVITLEADKINSTVDMGIYREGSMIGDRVFFDDLNGLSNGLQDVGELGANDVKVTLYDNQGQEINSTRTNVSGEYRFTNVPKGRYTIGFSELPSGYIFTTAKQGANDELDSDAKSNGRTETIFVDGKVNLTSIDAGLKKVNTGIASNDIKRGMTGQNVTLDILANDAEGTFNFDISTVRITSVPNGATLSDDGRTLTVPNEGVWVVDPETGAITFTPNEDFVGDPTPISYSVQDTQGNETGADVEINYPPLAQDDSVNAEVGQQVIVYVLENDSNTSSPLDPASLRLIDRVTGDEVETLVIMNQGTWSINIDGSLTFNPDSGLEVNPTPIEYIVREVAGDVSNRATVSILYPDAVDDSVIVPTNSSGDIMVNVSENDSSNTVPSSVTIGCENEGVKVLIVPREGTWSVGNDGTIVFSPEEGFIAEPTDIQYTIGLESGERSNCATVDIRREILAVDDTTTLNVGAPTLINVLSNDLGSLNRESVCLILPPVIIEGSMVNEDCRTLTVPTQGVWSVDDVGMVTFSPEENFSSSPVPIRYTVENNNGLVSNTANITLLEGGLSVIANDDVGQANGAEPVFVDVLANDSGDLNRSSVRIVTADGDHVLTYVVPEEGTWVVGDDGSITFTGEEGYVGTPTPIEYVVNDNSVAILSDTATVSISGTCVCTPYETSIPAMGQLAALIMLLSTLLTSILFLRKEFNTVK